MSEPKFKVGDVVWLKSELVMSAAGHVPMTIEHVILPTIQGTFGGPKTIEGEIHYGCVWLDDGKALQRANLPEDTLCK